MTRASDDVLGLLMLAFEGPTLPPAMAARLAAAPAAGVTLFRFLNVESAGQVRELTAAVQAAAGGALPLLVAADQEGGQFQALGDDATPFAGNMALGAAGDPGLALRVGTAIGRELRAVGVNVAYAPVCDLASNPANAAIGIRAFGDSPTRVAPLAAAMVRGLRAGGVAATAKHFPGLGDVDVDSHHALPVLDAAPDLAPFRAAVDAGADLVMSAHVALPAVTGDAALPATLSQAVIGDTLRRELGFTGLTITDALDMAALPQGPELAVDAIAALRAGVDLLLLTADEAARTRIEVAVRHAAARGLLDPAAIAAARDRLDVLRRRLAAVEQPPLATVGCEEHRRVAGELAERSLTLVRDDDGLLPLRLPADARVLAVMPRPVDLTPADTSSRVAPALAGALRGQHLSVDEVVLEQPIADADIAAARTRTATADVVVVGTLAASLDPRQVALVEALLATGVPTVTVALRTPWDLGAYPAARTHVATYGVLRPQLEALAAALVGRGAFPGRLPAAIPGLFPAGHGLGAGA